MNFATVQALGHEVWCDVEQLTAGCDWETGIATGLTWAKDANEHGRFLLLMTPHALRRPDGYCLNEIARAVTLKLRIFPVLVYDSEPPPALRSLPFFDMTDCVPGEECASSSWEDAFETILQSVPYQRKLNSLIAMLELVGAFSMNSYCRTLNQMA